jgi:hypothetical protein
MQFKLVVFFRSNISENIAGISIQLLEQEARPLVASLTQVNEPDDRIEP